jgi:aminopeptidase N
MNVSAAMACASDRAKTLIASTLAVLFIAAAGARAEPAFSFDATPGKLPKTVVPTHYAIELKPDLDTLLISGSEVADIEVAKPTAVMTLNAVNMSVEAAVIDDDTGQTGAIAFDAGAQILTLTFPRMIAAGPHRLRIGFTAHINKFGRGLYVVDYPTDTGRKQMISTQLEPADARRVFPCWDEPAFKASFALTVTVPQDFLAVSNMPIAREEPGGDGLKRVAFEPTPKMSSYLFVLAAGELERRSGGADGVSVGVVTTRGKSAQGRYALDSAIGLLKYYNDYFGVKYPLPKLDLIAVPGGFGGAMENWGGITFFESRLLFDPQSTTPEARRGIFIILAHEMAHQWFGDLITMAWWDNLWLNEGFASWMQAKAADRFNPDWQVWLNSSDAKQSAMSADAKRTTHPIQQPVADESEAMAVFDGITYIKGQAFIRMLENYLGEEMFRAGIRRYVQAHAFSNATTADLWQALEAASGQPVAAIAAAYTEQAGVPLIVAEVTCDDGQRHIVLRQERFTIHDPNATPQQWKVPLAYGPLRGAAPAAMALIDGTSRIDAGPCSDPLKLNLGDLGYYRVQYDAATQAALAKSIREMSPADRVNFLADTWASIEAGRLAPASFLDLVDALDVADSRTVWENVLRVFARLDHLERNRLGRGGFQAYARAKLRPVFDQFTWTRAANEPIERQTLRTRLIRALGELGDETILAEARRRFVAFVQNPASLRIGLRDPVVHLAGRMADRTTYDALHELARKTTNASERVRYYSALAAALDPALAQETLAIALTDEVPTNLVGTLVFGVASAGEHPDLAWAFVQENFAVLASRQGPFFRDSFAANLLANFSDRAHAGELASFAPARETAGGRMMSVRAQETILTDADFIARTLPAVDDWVARFLARP